MLIPGVWGLDREEGGGWEQGRGEQGKEEQEEPLVYPVRPLLSGDYHHHHPPSPSPLHRESG